MRFLDKSIQCYVFISLKLIACRICVFLRVAVRKYRAFRGGTRKINFADFLAKKSS